MRVKLGQRIESLMHSKINEKQQIIKRLMKYVSLTSAVTSVPAENVEVALAELAETCATLVQLGGSRDIEKLGRFWEFDY